MRVAQMMIDVEHVLAIDTCGRNSPARACIAHVAEDVERVRRASRPEASRETNSRVGQEAQVSRNRILLEVRDALSESFERQPERQTRPRACRRRASRG